MFRREVVAPAITLVRIMSLTGGPDQGEMSGAGLDVIADRPPCCDSCISDAILDRARVTLRAAAEPKCIEPILRHRYASLGPSALVLCC